MDNREQVSGNESNKNKFQTGSVKTNPSRNNRTGSGVNPDIDPPAPDEEGTNFDSENNDLEVNPGNLDREEVDLDRTGPDNSPKPQNYNAQAQADNQQGGDRGLDETKTKNDEGVKKSTLVGQGGYGTSGTSGTNSGGKQGYQSGLGSAGSQNGSTGYNAGSQGVDQSKGV